MHYARRSFLSHPTTLDLSNQCCINTPPPPPAQDSTPSSRRSSIALTAHLHLPQPLRGSPSQPYFPSTLSNKMVCAIDFLDVQCSHAFITPKNRATMRSGLFPPENNFWGHSTVASSIPYLKPPNHKSGDSYPRANT